MDAKTVTKQVTQALWSGETDRAKALLKKALIQVNSELQVAEKHVSELRELSSHLKSLAPKEMLESVNTNSSMGIIASVMFEAEVDKQSRNKKVLELAEQAASGTTNGTVRTNYLVDLVSREGIDMGVPENRIKTAVSNILLRSGGYEKVSEGVYRLPN